MGDNTREHLRFIIYLPLVHYVYTIPRSCTTAINRQNWNYFYLSIGNLLFLLSRKSPSCISFARPTMIWQWFFTILLLVFFSCFYQTFLVITNVSSLQLNSVFYLYFVISMGQTKDWRCATTFHFFLYTYVENFGWMN